MTALKPTRLNVSASSQERPAVGRPASGDGSRRGDDRHSRTGPRRYRRGVGSLHVILIVLSVLWIAPIVLLVSTTLKTDRDVAVNPFGLFTSFSFQNLANAWTQGHFSDYLLNSVLLSVPTTILVLVISTMAGYAFARLGFPGRTIAFYAIVLGLLVPFFAYMIPLFFQLRSMRLLDSLVGVILILTTVSLPFGTFFMRAFFNDLPSELEQSARVDGCSEWQIFTRVMLPLVYPGLGALGVFTFLQSWNNFLVPLLYVPSGGYQPLTLALYQFAAGRQIDIGPLAAGTFITILPVVAVFLALQRQVTQGFISGAMKG